jgi:hypothetical protein
MWIYTAEVRDIVDNVRIVTTTEILADRIRTSVTVATAGFYGNSTRLVFTEQGLFLNDHETAAQR